MRVVVGMFCLFLLCVVAFVKVVMFALLLSWWVVSVSVLVSSCCCCCFSLLFLLHAVFVIPSFLYVYFRVCFRVVMVLRSVTNLWMLNSIGVLSCFCAVLNYVVAVRVLFVFEGLFVFVFSVLRFKFADVGFHACVIVFSCDF